MKEWADRQITWARSFSNLLKVQNPEVIPHGEVVNIRRPAIRIIRSWFIKARSERAQPAPVCTLDKLPTSRAAPHFSWSYAARVEFRMGV